MNTPKPLIAALLNFFMPGVGYLYAQRRKTFCVILIAATLIALFLLYFYSILYFVIFQLLFANKVALFIVFLALVALAYDAARCAKKCNEPARAVPTAVFATLVVIGYALVMYTIYVTETYSFVVDEDHSEAPYERMALDRYLGVWLPGLTRPNPKAFVDRDEIIATGANTVGLGGGSSYNRKDGTYDPKDVAGDIEKWRAIIRYYKKKDLAVMFSLSSRENGNIGVGVYVPPEDIKSAYLENFKDVVIEFAKMAEEENVEVFVPFDELDRGDREVGTARASDWMQEILPRVREVFSGKIMWKGGILEGFYTGERIDFTGYDMIGFVQPIGAEADAELEKTLSHIRDWTEGPNALDLVVVALGPRFIPPPTPKQTARSVNHLFERGLDLFEGFMVLDLSAVVKDTVVEETMKNWFSTLK